MWVGILRRWGYMDGNRCLRRIAECVHRRLAVSCYGCGRMRLGRLMRAEEVTGRVAGVVSLDPWRDGLFALRRSLVLIN